MDREALEAERTLTRNEIFKELNSALRQLEPEEQTLVVLRYLEGKPFNGRHRLLLPLVLVPSPAQYPFSRLRPCHRLFHQQYNLLPGP